MAEEKAEKELNDEMTGEEGRHHPRGNLREGA